MTATTSLAAEWTDCMQRAIDQIQSHGAGQYSVKDDAHEALARSFSWGWWGLRYDAAQPRPSFCSGAVYTCILHALRQWDRGKRIPKEAWLALFPLRYQDGERAWGWANANAIGFAMLVEQLGAGYSFTDWSKAQPMDIIKMWWTRELGAKERGHIAILVEDKGESVLIWSSNQAVEGQAGGYGLRLYPKSKIKRVLFTRITQPAAFAKAVDIAWEPWLHSLLKQEVSWAACAQKIRMR